MENNQNSVWISKEEYERLRQAAGSLGAQPSLQAQVVAGGVLVASAEKPLAATRVIQKTSGIVAAISILFLFTGMGGESFLPILAACLGFSVPILVVSSLVLAVKMGLPNQQHGSIVHMPSLQQQKPSHWYAPQTTAGRIGMVLLAIIAVPVLYFGGSIILLMAFLSFGGDIGS